MKSNVDETFQFASENPPRQQHRFTPIAHCNANVTGLASFGVKFF